MTITSRHESLVSAGLLMLRLGIGGMMLVHGIEKMQRYTELAEKFPDPIGVGSQLSLILAIAAEVGCSLLLIVGFGSRLAAIPLAFTMIVALFVVHGGDAWKVKELAAVYLLVYGSLIVTGPGRFSLDHLVAASRANTDDDTGGGN